MTADEQLGLDVQIEVAATPEQVWEAISTGPGISAWFMPSEVDGGRITFHHMAGGSSEAEVTPAANAVLTLASNARSSITTRSTSATDRTSSPEIVTPPARTRSTRSGSATSVVTLLQASSARVRSPVASSYCRSAQRKRPKPSNSRLGPKSLKSVSSTPKPW